jgi:hypothetical protein
VGNSLIIQQILLRDRPTAGQFFFCVKMSDKRQYVVRYPT